jgi:hypothetical protein
LDPNNIWNEQRGHFGLEAPMREMNNFTGEVPSMPSGDGKPLKPLVCKCRDCDFTGGLHESIEHDRLTRHRLTHRGYVQDFSHLRSLGPILPGGKFLPKREE